VWNKDASRVAFQLSGNVGLRDAISSFSDIVVCLQDSPNVADCAKNEMVAKFAKKVRKQSLSASGQVMASKKGTFRAEKMEDTLSHLSNKDA
jgi:hypothetical protein